jgi:hypothetical protein
MSKIFISYRREDSADIVGRIFEHLVQEFASYTWASFTGNEWNAMTTREQGLYIAGTVDGWIAAEAIRTTNVEKLRSSVSDVVECIHSRKMTYSQFSAIVSKQIKEHPEKWDQKMSLLIMSSLLEACFPEQK